MTDTKTEMAQSIPGTEIMIRGKSAGVEIFFQRFDQGIKTRVDDRAAVEVDDPMGTSTEIAHAQGTVLGATQGNQSPVAISKALGWSHHRLDRMADRSNALHSLRQDPLLPIELGRFIDVLKGAPTTVTGQDAGGLASSVGLRAPLHQPTQPAGLASLL